MRLRRLPPRLATGAYILHSGLEKWEGDEERAKLVHGMAVGAYPFLEQVPPTRFLRMLALAEIVVGTVLVLPVVGNRLAGLALTGFSAALVTMYLRTPSLHRPGSVWPTPAGMAVSKDIWMVGTGLGLILDRAP